MTDRPRLIEVAFPLKQASLDSVHEKNVRHGHISTLHIWPARRPLAACRAALIATLLPDPGDAEDRKELLERIGGRVVKKVTRKKAKGKDKAVETVKEVTQGGILHWGNEQNSDVAWFREKIREVYGRAPRVLDPFAGGGAIPLEAMRLGCEVTAIDINPVAWFILKCTLEYPQKLAGKTVPLPKFALESPELMGAFRERAKVKVAKGVGKKGKLKGEQKEMFEKAGPIEADLAWHVRAWGYWVLERARKELARYYPVVDGKPTVAYLWARTVKCKNCRATIPLLKTRWLCRKENKRVLLAMSVRKDGTGVEFGIEHPTAAQAKDKKLGAGTMSRAGATCPCCPGAIMTMEDLRLEGKAGRLGKVLFAVVVDAPEGKSYRLPTLEEISVAQAAGQQLDRAFDRVPFGVLSEQTPGTAGTKNDSCALRRYGINMWQDVFTERQLVSLVTFAECTRTAPAKMIDLGYSDDWREAIFAYLCAMQDRLANQCSVIARWNQGGENIEGTFARFAIPMVWDFAEVNPLGDTSGGYTSAVEWVRLTVAHTCQAASSMPEPAVLNASATAARSGHGFDLVLTDPPYYDAIPYSNLMDFFYVWLRRTLRGSGDDFDNAFNSPLALKWDHARGDGELIDDPMRFDRDETKSKAAYEDGMFRAFHSAWNALNPEGRLVVVFAHKNPDAWESLVGAIIRAGFVVDGSWPIQTERTARARSFGSAALSSSVWLVCKKRPEAARPGWDNRVLEEIREKIYLRLREFWDAGIRGPDFVWAATGPALEAYSKHPVVKKANEPGQVMAVGEFLRHVRRIVVDFVVGRVLTRGGAQAVSGLDDVTTYYLLHRNDFGMEEAPAGACILYAVSCGLSDNDLTDHWDILVRTGKASASDSGGDDDDSDNGAEEETEEEQESDTGAQGSGGKMCLRTWADRKHKNLGLDSEGRPAPLIDQVHRLMHLWRAKDVNKVDEYLDQRALRKSPLFHQLLQALIELAPEKSEERPLLESLSNHIAPRSHGLKQEQTALRFTTEPPTEP